MVRGISNLIEEMKLYNLFPYPIFGAVGLSVQLGLPKLPLVTRFAVTRVSEELWKIPIPHGQEQLCMGPNLPFLTRIKEKMYVSDLKQCLLLLRYFSMVTY